MPRGGCRYGSGRKSTWKSGCRFEETKLIRVPSAIADELLDIAHWLDSGGTFEKVTKSKTLRLDVVPDKPLEIETNSKGYTETAFAQLIGINRSTLKSRKKKYLDGLTSEAEFCAYLREQDPHSRNWRYSNVSKKYYFDD
jgi:hypothetical protein